MKLSRLKELAGILSESKTQHPRKVLRFNEAANAKRERALKSWVNLNAEDMYSFAVDALSDTLIAELDRELRGFDVEDESDHEEANKIIYKFLSQVLAQR